MLVMPLITAALETGLNRLLYPDTAMKPARQRLKGKVLRIEMAELDNPVILVFGDAQLDVLTVWDDQADCTVKTHLGALPALSDRQNLPLLIKNGSLDVSGDLQVVQQFVTLLDMAEADPADLLAPYLGDILAEGLTQSVGSRLTGLKRRLAGQQDWLAQSITEEWRLSPSALEQAWFAEEVDNLSQKEVSLAVRLKKLEASR